MDVICFDVGGTYIKYALLSQNGEILQQAKIATPYQVEGFQKVIADVVDELSNGRRLAAVGISMPGYINPHTGYAERAGALEYLDNRNLIDLLSEKITLPIYIENDANCAALAERYSGNAQGAENFVVMTIGTGIGTAFYLNGGLYRGANFKAGEYGHSRINYQMKPNDTLHDIFTTRILVKRYKELMGINHTVLVNGEEVFETAKNNPDVESLVQNWVQWLCVGIYNLACTFNPEKILIGGGISANPELLPRIQQQMDLVDERWTTDFHTVIEPCKYRNNAGILGAFYCVQQQSEKMKI
ncbi:ROK family protein [Desemzia sp. RIT804]|uniref:ROK family protein n=1 Tax=Desemzia sp. RIT 804 TaxID=2810209 RepID=UPI001950451E|nr:ROK family protein [Desemzia sp. RIT 804]MBM6614284.1 ROK family protein [Desemzia sp. RIT 804]